MLEGLATFDDVLWESGQSKWGQALVSASAGDYYAWPSLTSIMPWQHSGTQLKRLWPIAEAEDLLRRRWRALLTSQDRAGLFRETRDRRVSQSYPDQLGEKGVLPAIGLLPEDTEPPEIVRYGYRSFDRQWVFQDTRVGDFYRPPLWRLQSLEQMFLVSGLSMPLGTGPAAVCWTLVPDIDSFRGSFGAKHVIPLYRDAAATEPNITHRLLDLLGETYGEPVTPEDLIGYIAGVLGHPGYTARFHDELEVPGPRVPLTKDVAFFRRAVDLGQQVIAWQTYAERFPESLGTTQGRVPTGAARVLTAIPDDPDGYP